MKSETKTRLNNNLTVGPSAHVEVGENPTTPDEFIVLVYADDHIESGMVMSFMGAKEDLRHFFYMAFEAVRDA